ncbi:MAG: Cna B-type domain-containing protein [[Clostridium] aminophilum]|uniref:Cna B-type domain-containing protein n=1 Tax=[Clostridium] aminophilum TaxID=1526 RepID=UPI0026EC640C|nr:Cna B-type domain-containing protein [[Clostridium] aminophilum]MDD6196076.1 Cna B-type domain-containing protein [[Clostridium] aminophilum]
MKRSFLNRASALMLDLPKTIRAVVVDHSFYDTDKAYEVYHSIAPTGDETKDRRKTSSDEEEEKTEKTEKTDRASKAVKPKDADEEKASAVAGKKENADEPEKSDKAERETKAEKPDKAENTVKSGENSGDTDAETKPAKAAETEGKTESAEEPETEKENGTTKEAETEKERKAQADMVGKLYREGDGTISEKTNSIALTNTYDPPLNYRITAEKTWEGYDSLTEVQKSKPVSVKFVLYRSVGLGTDGTPLTYAAAKTWLKAAEQTVTLNPEDFAGLAAAGNRSEVTFDSLPYYGPDGSPSLYKIAEEDPDTTKKVVGTAYAVLTETEQDGQKLAVKTANSTVPIMNSKAPAADADGTDATASGNGLGTAALINYYSNDLSLTVKKEWKDGAAEKTGTDHMPGEIHVTVYRTADGYEPETVANLTLTKEHGWTVSGETAAEGSAAETPAAETDSRLSGLPKYAPDGSVYIYHAAENLSGDEDRAFHIPADAEDAAEAENIGKLALPDEWSGVYTKLRSGTFPAMFTAQTERPRRPIRF